MVGTWQSKKRDWRGRTWKDGEYYSMSSKAQQEIKRHSMFTSAQCIFTSLCACECIQTMCSSLHCHHMFNLWLCLCSGDGREEPWWDLSSTEKVRERMSPACKELLTEGKFPTITFSVHLEDEVVDGFQGKLQNVKWNLLLKHRDTTMCLMHLSNTQVRLWLQHIKLDGQVFHYWCLS